MPGSAASATSSNSDEFANGSGNTSAGAATEPAFSSCVASAQRAVPSGTVILEATATYRQTPALVVVLQAAGTSSPAKRTAVVVAQSGCRVLLRTTP
jgi:hypothetical protein